MPTPCAFVCIDWIFFLVEINGCKSERAVRPTTGNISWFPVNCIQYSRAIEKYHRKQKEHLPWNRNQQVQETLYTCTYCIHVHVVHVLYMYFIAIIVSLSVASLSISLMLLNQFHWSTFMMPWSGLSPGPVKDGTSIVLYPYQWRHHCPHMINRHCNYSLKHILVRSILTYAYNSQYKLPSVDTNFQTRNIQNMFHT